MQARKDEEERGFYEIASIESLRVSKLNGHCLPWTMVSKGKLPQI